MKSAVDFSKWFVNKGLDNPTDTLNGNTKLQKLLFFSWLIHYKKFGECLFDDDFHAFQNGPVVEKARQIYAHNYNSLIIPNANELEISESGTYTEFGIEFTEKEITSLRLTEALFGDATADELTKISHNSPVWSKYHSIYMKSSSMCASGERPSGMLSRMPKSELTEELRMIGNVISSYEYSLEHPDDE